MKVIRDLVGEVFSGRYRLISRLAGGGMGEVYRGHDLLLDRPVAVKVLDPSLASDPTLVERFKEEARAAARLMPRLNKVIELLVAAPPCEFRRIVAGDKVGSPAEPI